MCVCVVYFACLCMCLLVVACGISGMWPVNLISGFRLTFLTYFPLLLLLLQFSFTSALNVASGLTPLAFPLFMPLMHTYLRIYVCVWVCCIFRFVGGNLALCVPFFTMANSQIKLLQQQNEKKKTKINTSPSRRQAPLSICATQFNGVFGLRQFVCVCVFFDVQKHPNWADMIHYSIIYVRRCCCCCKPLIKYWKYST